MKISYKILQNYIPNIKSPEDVAEDLILHTAEVEKIYLEGENLKDVFIGEIIEIKKHPDSEKLNLCKVNILGKEKQIVCGAPNVKVGIKVPIAIVGANLGEDFEIKKTKIRGEISEGMICSLDELGLTEERQTGIMILPDDAVIGKNMREYLEKNDSILEIDNKAINHRPDLFSHIGVIRELFAINGESFDFEYEDRDFSELENLGVKNEIPEVVNRYIGLEVKNVLNIESPEYIKTILRANDIEPKGLLIDITNYSLYFYGKPTHCFDADKIKGNITIRYAKPGESFLALNDKIYKPSISDIVIADDSSIIALGGIIGGKNSAVSEGTTNIIIESANFDHSTVRKTGKSLGIRTDSLNLFEKDLLSSMADKSVSLIISELEKFLPNITLGRFSDLYEKKQEKIQVQYDFNQINSLIGIKYEEHKVLDIIKNLGIKKEDSILKIPFWRKDLEGKADIAEEIARIDGYNNVVPTIPRINLGAIKQDSIYTVKKDTRDFFTNRGFFDMYSYSFVGEKLMNKIGSSTNGLVELKNSLSEDSSHMRNGIIVNLLLSLEKNIRDFSEIKMFELEKVFSLKNNEISENYELSGVITSKNKVVYYDIQEYVSLFFQKIGISSFYFEEAKKIPIYAHSTRTANIILRGKIVGIVGEIHPKIASNFDIKDRIGFFEINIDKIVPALYSITKVKELSSFQENHFDLNFVLDKKIKGRDIKMTIEKSNTLITEVELFDVYENEEKLPGKRSLSFKIFFQSQTETLSDEFKNELIKEIVKKVEKKGGVLR